MVVYSINTVYLDSSTIVNCHLDDTTVKISGDYIDKIFIHFGAASAFVVGSRLAAAFVTKHPISLFGKMELVAGSGSMTSVYFQLRSTTAGVIIGIMSGHKNSDNSFSIHIKDVNISSDINQSNGVELSQLNMDSLLNKQIIIPKFKGDFISIFEEKINLISSNDNSKSKIVVYIEKSSDSTISEIFGQDNSTIIEKIKNSIINSPLESNDVGISQTQLLNDMTTILTYNLTLNIFMLYLISVLIFAFTIRFVIDSEIILSKMKSLPLGKYTHYILTKIFSFWKDSNILWIYFILFCLFVFSCSSSYAIYGCLFILDYLTLKKRLIPYNETRKKIYPNKLNRNIKKY